MKPGWAFALSRGIGTVGVGPELRTRPHQGEPGAAVHGRWSLVSANAGAIHGGSRIIGAYAIICHNSAFVSTFPRLLMDGMGMNERLCATDMSAGHSRRRRLSCAELNEHALKCSWLKMACGAFGAAASCLEQ